MSRRLRAFVAAFLASTGAALVAIACSSPTEPRFVDVELSSLSIDAWMMDRTRLLYVSGRPSDGSLQLRPMHRLRASVTTSAGDVEAISFASQLCDGDYACHSLSVMMKDGRDVRELEALFDSLPARLALGVVWSESGDTVHVADWFATIWVFDPADVRSVMDAVSRQPGVAIVERQVFGFSLGGDAPVRSLVLALRPAERSVVVEGDGVVQFQPGDTITVRYRQPDGSALTTSAVVP